MNQGHLRARVISSSTDTLRTIHNCIASELGYKPHPESQRSTHFKSNIYKVLHVASTDITNNKCMVLPSCMMSREKQAQKSMPGGWGSEAAPLKVKVMGDALQPAWINREGTQENSSTDAQLGWVFGYA